MRSAASAGGSRPRRGCRSSPGIDRFLPPAFGDLHPTWRTPYVALLVQAAIAGVFVFLGQAGTSVHGAYDALVSMGIIAYFIPFLFMFAAMIVLQREPAGPEVMRVPGGRPVAIALAAIGFVVTAMSIVLACVPPDEEPNKMLAVVKVVGLSVVLVGVGAVVYCSAAARAKVGEQPHRRAAACSASSLHRLAIAQLSLSRRRRRCAWTTTTPATRRRSASASIAWSSSRCRGPATRRGRSTTRTAASISSKSSTRRAAASLYSRGFSSIYGEWETTGEAKEMNRTFSESLRFPAPDATGAASSSRSATRRTCSATSGRRRRSRRQVRRCAAPRRRTPDR